MLELSECLVSRKGGIELSGKEMVMLYKSQLQEYAQKAGFMFPTYDHVKEGLSHDPRFKATVLVNNQSYESPPGFGTLKAAEHAAAKVALDALQETTEGLVPNPVHESGLCKNLLQQYAQKYGYALPQYTIVRQGEEHSLVFIATCEVAGVSYTGGAAKSKKDAEIKAARTAMLVIQTSDPDIGVQIPQPEPETKPEVLPVPVRAPVTEKFQKRRKRRGPAKSLEEPHATRVKQCSEQVGEPVTNSVLVS